MAVVYLAFGSNLGDRHENIHRAVDRLALSGITVLQLSSLIETDPVGGPLQGRFINAVARCETDLLPEKLLKVCLSVEKALGRIRTVKDGPRTIDIDILLYDDLVLKTPDLVIPHPRMQEREFVMQPLSEVRVKNWC